MGEETKNFTTATDSIPVEFTRVETSIAAATLILIMVFTVIGNCTICVVIFKNKKMWNEMNMFLLNLALGDIALCMSMGFSLVTAIKREWSNDRSVCIFNGILTTTLLCNTVFTHALISIDRYIAVVLPMRKIMTKKKAALMILAGWVLSLAIALAPALGWGSIGYNGSTMQCGTSFPKTTLDCLYVFILALFGFILPISIMSCAYTKIYLTVKRHVRRLSDSTVGESAARSAMEMKQKVSLTFFLAFIAFILCWSPFFVFVVVAVVMPSRDDIPHGLGIAAFWCGFLDAACNPFIIGFRSEHFREVFYKLLRWLVPLRKCRSSFPENTEVIYV